MAPIHRLIRVVYVTGEPTPYRTPHLEALAARPELELHIVYAARTIQRRTWSTPDSEYVTYLRGPSLPLTRLLHHDYPLTLGIWPLLERLRPDCVVIGGWSLLATQLAIAWCRLRRVPYLLQSDNHLREPRRTWIRLIKRAVLPRIVPQAAALLVPGSLAHAHVLAYGADSRRIVRFPLTVDVRSLATRIDQLRTDRVDVRARLNIAADAVVVLQVARLIPVKATDLLVSAIARVDAPLHLALVGEGPDEARLRELAHRLAVPVTFTGSLEGDNLWSAYAVADIFALLSHRETWGVVVNEAAAAGLPLVLSDRVGAAADLLVPGRNGVLVPSGDAAATAVALSALATDPELRRRQGAESRAMAAGWGYADSVGDLVTLMQRITSDRWRHSG